MTDADRPAPPPDPGETLVQSGEALARAKDTTGAAGVVPPATAPVFGPA
jgi:hypothetical protein